jgi:hypothetical protein
LRCVSLPHQDFTQSMSDCVTLVPREDQTIVVDPPESVEHQTVESSAEIRCVLFCHNSIGNVDLMSLFHCTKLGSGRRPCLFILRCRASLEPILKSLQADLVPKSAHPTARTTISNSRVVRCTTPADSQCRTSDWPHSA